MKQRTYTKHQVNGFAEVAQSLKLARRAELVDEATGKTLINDLYVDPLPHNAVLTSVLKPNTTFLIGRKGTGKSTIFQKAQASIRLKNKVASTYLDIKTLFEESQGDHSFLSKLDDEKMAMSPESISRLLLYRSFLFSLISGIRDELKRKLKESFWEQIKESFSGSIEDLFADFDSLLDEANDSKLVSIVGAIAIAAKDKTTKAKTKDKGFSVKGSASGISAEADFASRHSTSSEDERQFSDILLKTFSLKTLLLSLKDILESASIRHLFVFIDDFSELPEEAMRIVVDSLIAPLNNWSEEYIKFKIAAYPNRIYYGQIDKTKIDEVYLDLFQLYGTSDVATMEDKATEFVTRLLTSRVENFCGCKPEAFFLSNGEDLWRTLFFASMGNPRTLGYLLSFIQESTIIYGKKIGIRSVRDAAQRFYEEKLLPYFDMNKFLHESFTERSSIFSLKELLEKIVTRARELRSNKESHVMRDIIGQPPTSHFHVVRDLEQLFNTLELNFFLNKYFEMSDRAGRRISVYALNYGLCQKFSIEFGRPKGKREFRLYFVERIFDYSGLVRKHVDDNQEIKCDRCGTLFGMDALPTLKQYGMLCPKCKEGTCTVINLSRKYEEALKAVNENLLLRPTELGILKTLKFEERPLYAGEIAGELDCSYQLIGKRAKTLSQLGLVKRDKNDENRREFSITRQAMKTYFSKSDEAGLQVPDDVEPPTASAKE